MVPETYEVHPKKERTIEDTSLLVGSVPLKKDVIMWKEMDHGKLWLCSLGLASKLLSNQETQIIKITSCSLNLEHEALDIAGSFLHIHFYLLYC